MNAPTPSLGRLERVPLRRAWASEAQDFTPWLGLPENLRLLGETVGMVLEPEAQEQAVGPFRADILAKNVPDGTWVLIENQLERTDHCHLGQLLTYAAGLDAVTIIWLAERFTEEHRAALDWLNEKTPDGIGFFGLEVELWRIGESPLAPKFNVVCRPNEWTRGATAARATADPELGNLCRDYWAGVLKELAPKRILTADVQPVRQQHMSFPVGWHDFHLKAYFSRVEHKLGVWVSCRGLRGVENLAALQAEREAIEAAFGGPLRMEVYERDQGRGTIIQVYEATDPTNREDWPRQHALLADRITALYKAMAARIERLDRRAGDSESSGLPDVDLAPEATIP